MENFYHDFLKRNKLRFNFFVWLIVLTALTTTSAFAQITGTTPASRCLEGSVTLRATAQSGTIKWFTVPFYGTAVGTGTTFTTPSLTGTTTYFVDAVDETGCSLNTNNARVPVTATINAGSMQAIIFYESSTFCRSVSTAQTPTRTGTAGGTYTATNGLSIDQTTGAFTPSANSTGNYVITYTVTASEGCVENPTSTTIYLTDAPVQPSISYSGSPWCTTESSKSVSQSGATGGIYTASPSGLTLNSSTGVITPSTSLGGTYVVTYFVSAAGGCAPMTATTTVSITGLPTASINYNGADFCKSNTTAQSPNLSGTNSYTGGSYSASPAGLTINSSTGAITPSSSTAGTYTVTYTISAAQNCSSVTATCHVTINPLPTASFAADNATVCQGATSPRITFTGASGTAPYTFSYTVNDGATQMLTTTSGSTNYIDCPTISAGTTVYKLLSVGDANGCSQSVSGSSVTITVTASPVATFNYTGSPYCKTGTAVPTMVGTATKGTFAATGVTFIDASTGEIDLVTTPAGTYTVTNTIASCGGVTETATITINALPTVSIDGTSECGDYLLTASITASNPVIKWYKDGSEISGVTSSTYIATATGTYTVNVMDGSTGCSNTSSGYNVTSINPIPTVTAQTDNTTACGSTILSATATNATSYQWYKGGSAISGANSLTYSAEASGAHSIMVTGAGTCTATSETLNITVYPIPTASISGTLIACGSTVLTASTGTASPTYQWYKDGTVISGATESSCTVTSSGAYTVKITEKSSDCSDTSATSTVTINAVPEASVDGASTVDYNSTSSYTAPSGSYTYAWAIDENQGSISSGATSQSVSVKANTPGTFTIGLQLSNGTCTSTTTKTVYIIPVITGDLTACDNTVLTASPNSVTNYTYQWYKVVSGSNTTISGATGSTYTATASGSYVVTVTSKTTSAGGTSAASVVTINPLPTAFNVTGGGTYCSGGDGMVIGLDGSETGINYQLLKGGVATGTAVAGTGSAISFGKQTLVGTAIYTVVATNATTSCTQTMTGSTTITVVADPTLNTQPNVSMCVGGMTILGTQPTGGTGNISYQWKYSADGSTNWANVANGTPSGFTYTITAEGGYQELVVTGTGSETAQDTYYKCVLTSDGCGCDVTETGAIKVTIVADPYITTQPTSPASICIGGTGTMTIAAAGGITTTPHYYWQYYNGTSWDNVSDDTPSGAVYTGKDATTFSVSGITSAGAYKYRCIVNRGGSYCNDVTSDEVTVTVVADPSWAINSVTTTTTTYGSAVTLSSTVQGGLGGDISWIRSDEATPNASETETVVTTGNVPPSVGTWYYRPHYVPTGSGCNLSDGGVTAVTITKAPLTITAADQTISYGTAKSTVTGAGSYTPTGFVNGESSSVISGTVSYITTYTATTPAGTSGVTITPDVTGLTATNYSFTAVNGSITITQASSTITVTGTSSFTYTGSAQGPNASTVNGSTGAVTYSYSGTGSTTYTASSTAPTAVGTYQVIATVAADTNYTGASSEAYAFTIYPAAPTGTATQTFCSSTAQ